MNAVPLASRLLGCPRLPATGQGFPPQATPMGRPSWFGAPCMLQPKIPQTPMAARQELCPDAPRSAVQSLLFLARSEQRLFILTGVGENDSCSPDPRPACGCFAIRPKWRCNLRMDPRALPPQDSGVFSFEVQLAPANRDIGSTVHVRTHQPVEEIG